MSNNSCFKANDVRGQYPLQLDENLAERIGYAFAVVRNVQTIVVGRDIRLSSASLSAALIQGLVRAGVAVTDIGLCGTEEVYFATAFARHDGGIMITASHNPADYNGLKFVGKKARPIHSDNGLGAIRDRAFSLTHMPEIPGGSVVEQSFRQEYLNQLLSYVDQDALRPLRIACNAGNGCASLVLDALAPLLPFSCTFMNHEPDGHFPNGVPNPLLPHNRAETAEFVRQHKCDLGIAWDGDFDRCFFFDEAGNFVDGYYIVGLLAKAMLSSHGKSAVVYDTRLVWNTQAVVQENGGRPVESRTGHSFIKELMRSEKAAYGGEMSGHYYFRNFFYCDSGMIPWLLVAQLLCTEQKPLSALVQEYQQQFPISGEINFVADPEKVLAAVSAYYEKDGPTRARLDGLGLEFTDWRFNLRASNTEPLVRLNVESRGNGDLVEQKVQEISEIIRSVGGHKHEAGRADA